LQIMQQKLFYQKQLNIKLKTYRFTESQVNYGGSFAARERVQKISVLGSRIKRQKVAFSDAAKVQQKQAQSFDEIEYSATLYVEFILSSL
ncbi:MAG: hypothetical protein Q9M92_06295, partial [Enterobacterales bacterium]|nr:hypothetical protein [Enterobacterales bacterium]